MVTVGNVVVNLAPAYDALTPAQVAGISVLLAGDAISFAQAREVLDAVNGTDLDPEKVVDERGMRQVSDTGALEPVVDAVLARCGEQVEQYRAADEAKRGKMFGFFVGQAMKASKGKANPQQVNELLKKKLEA